MRAVAVTVWIFINLVFFGMCGYIYLLWTQYWHYIIKNQQHVVKKPVKVDRPLVDYYQEQLPMEVLNSHRQALINAILTTESTVLRPKPRFKGHHRRKSSTQTCEQCDELSKRISAFKSRLIIRLRRVLHDESNVYRSRADNPYSVSYKGTKESSANLPSKTLLCRLKKAVPLVRTISGLESAFIHTALRPVISERPLFEHRERYNNCAIVTNSGALIDSGLGGIIDSHGLVLRFNHAPTKGYEKDVGHKTTIRILNSQVVSKKEFKFLKSKMYEDVKLLAWDPCNYTSTLEEWRDKPDFDVFTPFIKHRRLKPNTNLHLLDPRILWNLWDFLQAHTPLRIRQNPPSSGFLGISLLLPVCDTIRLFEYVPSLRLTPKCHYFDKEVDSSCTFGVWHPLAAEKLLSLALNEENDLVTYNVGYITVSGFSSLSCST